MVHRKRVFGSSMCTSLHVRSAKNGYVRTDYFVEGFDIHVYTMHMKCLDLHHAALKSLIIGPFTLWNQAHNLREPPRVGDTSRSDSTGSWEIRIWTWASHHKLQSNFFLSSPLALRLVFTVGPASRDNRMIGASQDFT